MPPDKPPKPRIDLRGPEYPHAPYICMAVLAVQAFLADHWSPESLFALSLLTLFVAMAAHHRAVTRTGRTELTAPAFIGLTAVYGGGLHFVFLHGFVPDGTLLWIAAGLAALYPQVRRVRKRLLEARLRKLAADNAALRDRLFKARPRRTGDRAPKFMDKAREDRVQFVELLARTATAFACADGAFTETKRAAILDFFTVRLGYSGARLGSIRLFIEESQGPLWSLVTLLQRFRQTCAYDSHLTLLELLFRVARASGPDTEQALSLAREIGLTLDLSPQVVRDMEEKSRESEADRAREEAERRERIERARREQEQAARRRREEEARRRRREQEEEARRRASESAYQAALSREARAFAVLELAPGAKFSTIKKRYRRLIAQHHPDKAAHLGEAARRAAEERSKELNAAYGYLKERYGG